MISEATNSRLFFIGLICTVLAILSGGRFYRSSLRCFSVVVVVAADASCVCVAMAVGVVFAMLRRGMGSNWALLEKRTRFARPEAIVATSYPLAELKTFVKGASLR